MCNDIERMDIAAGVLLLQASGGRVVDKEGNKFVFNRPKSLIANLVTPEKHLFSQLKDLLEISAVRY
jgi:fructose-1,6-bisphosphatase/inositol monophosphatase family enzyme